VQCNKEYFASFEGYNKVKIVENINEKYQRNLLRPGGIWERSSRFIKS
jgi:hypothetical protein